MSDIVLFGCGAGSDMAFRYFSKDSPHHVRAFTVEKAYIMATTFHGLPVLPFEDIETTFPPSQVKMFVPLGYQGMNDLRAQKYLAGKKKGYQFVNYISSHNYTLEELDIGENCLVLQNQSINLDVKIGNNVVIWSSNQIGDRSVIMDNVWMSSQVVLSGDVTIGENSFLGVNSTISNNVVIARKTYVGARALISKNTDENGVYVESSTKLFPAVSADKFLHLLGNIR